MCFLLPSSHYIRPAWYDTENCYAAKIDSLDSKRELQMYEIIVIFFQ